MSLEDIVRRRINQSTTDIHHALEMIRKGNPFAAEINPDRRKRRIQAKLNISQRDAEAIDDEVQRRTLPDPPLRAEGMEALLEGDDVTVESTSVSPVRSLKTQEAIWGDTVDFVSVAFLERGARVARSVGRVAFRSGRAKGTGVLIGNGLFLTNNHVIETSGQADECYIEFDYERDLSGNLREPTLFLIDPSLFITDPVSGLDFTVFSLGDRVSGTGELSDFGASPLSAARDKHMIGEFANIVQHPRGRFKEVVLRENRLVNRFDDALHYIADTEPGSSGSPVYNSEWQLIALHHWGGPWIDHDANGTPASYDINEGIRISSIVRKLRHRMRSLAPDQRQRIAKALSQGEDGAGIDQHTDSGFARDRKRGAGDETINAPSVSVDADGRATWRLPIEVSVYIPALASKGSAPGPVSPSEQRTPPASEGDVTDEYSDRKGYLADFLPGFHVPLPRLGPELLDDAAHLLEPEPGANPYELKYHHFSVVMNKRRRLAFFTACMIDGKTAKSIHRRTRKVSDLKPGDTGLREAIEALDHAEADSWTRDPRLAREDYSGNEIYKGQRVPGFQNPRSSGRIARMFQKGHLVRRLDPAWGEESRALEAELDTFHWTNAAPQVGFFNQGKADNDQPGTGGGKLWRAAENYVLRNAVAEEKRVLSFTGSIFRNDDRPYRHIRIPARFFKITAWSDQGTLRSLALIVDQAQVFDAWPEALGSPEFMRTATEEEAFLDAKELERVQDFLSTVEEIEDLTGIDFGDALRDSDVRAGEASVEVRSQDDLPVLRDRTDGRSDSTANQPTKNAHDDLTKIKGIGPALARRLNDHEVFQFSQIAAWSEEDVTAMNALLRFPGRIERDSWVEQARKLASARP